MAVSQNGYPANDRSFITTYEVTKAGRLLALRSGPAGQLLAHWVRWFDENIRDIDPGILDDWGYAERPIRGGTELSNHASGTAADVDATKWPLGVQPEAYLTAAEIAEVRARLQVYEGCIRWGGDYIGRKDPMHFEVNRPEVDCARVLKKLIDDPAEPDPPTPNTNSPLEDEMPTILRRVGDGDAHLLVEGVAVPIRDDKDMTELRDKERLHVLDVTPTMYAATLASIRAKGQS